MNTVPPLSRRVLDTLHPGTAGEAARTEQTTGVTRAFAQVEMALDAHVAALADIDRIEEAVVAEHGYPRVPMPGTGTTPDYAADTATITRRLGHGLAARRLRAELRRRQEIFARASRTAGLDGARAAEARTAGELSEVTGHLLLAPTQSRTDITIKLAVLIAAGEATAEEALAFPWVYLRALHADLRSLLPEP